MHKLVADTLALSDRLDSSLEASSRALAALAAAHPDAVLVLPRELLEAIESIERAPLGSPSLSPATHAFALRA